ncbi:MAG: methyltransferase [Treponema sp.]|nr:methyltransferase [Candidatus Treponema equifaecale]
METNSSLRTDILKNTGYKILQDENRFCFGKDAVLLAEFASSAISKNSRAVDLGAGNGIVSLLMCDEAQKNFSENTCRFEGLEIQKESWELAQKSVELNGLTEKISIIQGDIKKVQEIFEKNSCDIVTSNPPYKISGTGRENPESAKLIARHEILCNLDDVVKAAAFLLKDKGSFFMIHRPERIADILNSLSRHKLKLKSLQFLQPAMDKAPTMVLIEARRTGNFQPVVLPARIIN